MAIFKCKMCGGDLEVNENMTVGTCKYCGSTMTLPRIDNDKKANLYDRANHFRRNKDFDKAMSIYENILNENGIDAEAYWSLVLCKYGIEYVEDPVTHKRVPTCNRTQFTSIFADEDYKAAIANADANSSAIYETEAKAIDEIQKKILEISSKESPFDVFICYKESDSNGGRTHDSVLAQDLYYQLVKEGFKVFFSKITLEDKLGNAYEPYIFAALNSSKVMVVLGTKIEYFNATWLKNEWSRYLSLIKNGANKILIPAYRDIDPYDLPEEFSHIQAQDMNKLGFMQDLIRGIKKITKAEEPKANAIIGPTLIQGNNNTMALLKRIFMFLNDSDFNSADAYCERVLDIDPENATAYVGKLMVELHLNQEVELTDSSNELSSYKNFEKALKFANKEYKLVLEGYNEASKRNIEEETRKERLYKEANIDKESGKSEIEYLAAAEKFRSISGYKDAEVLTKECEILAEKEARTEKFYKEAKKYKETVESESEYLAVAEKFGNISGYKDADELAIECENLAKKILVARIYKEAKDEKIASVSKNEEEVLAIAEKFRCISGYKDADALAIECQRIATLKAEKTRSKKTIFNIVKIVSWIWIGVFPIILANQVTKDNNRIIFISPAIALLIWRFKADKKDNKN